MRLHRLEVFLYTARVRNRSNGASEETGTLIYTNGERSGSTTVKGVSTKKPKISVANFFIEQVERGKKSSGQD